MTAKPELEELLQTVAEERGLDLRGYKRTTLTRRIARRMDLLKLKDYGQYLKHVRDNAREINDLLNCILINVTRFFRDPNAWRLLQTEVLPRLLDGHRDGSPFRVWCAGCATGEEPYSVAMLLAEHFGDSLRQQDIKIYGTDQDEAALRAGRQAQYSAEHLAGMPPEWRSKYFEGPAHVPRVHRDLRRMVIFGRANILRDAPIPHVKLLVCRNLLIYFDSVSQQRILARLEYALDPGGVLFLGKTETQLRGNPGFAQLNAKWRMFQRISGGKDLPKPIPDDDELRLAELRAFHESVLNTIQPGVLILDISDTVISENEAVHRLWELKQDKLTGLPLAKTELARVCPELLRRLEESRGEHPEPVRFEYAVGNERQLAITIKPIMSKDQSGQVGTLIHMDDVSSHETHQETIEELETTTEELQSANEELETTNEELQSTNEELETTNEELQSSNEELETTNEELQSLNEELETTNEELAERTRQLDQVNQRYHEMIEHLPSPMLLIDKDHQIYMYNSAAKKMLGFAAPSKAGMSLTELPLQDPLNRLLVRTYGAVAASNRPAVLRNRQVRTNRATRFADIHITPLSGTMIEHGVLLMFNMLRDSGENQPRAKINNTKRAPVRGNSKRGNSSKSNNRRKRK